MTVDLEPLKRDAAEAAIEAEVGSGMALGLGTGSTAAWVLEGLARRLADGTLSEIAGVPTSERTAQRCRELGIPLIDLERRPSLDLAIDGADEIAPDLSLIKGLGGAQLREKIVARSAERFVVVADETKLVARLGERAPVPVEVIPFARPLCERLLVAAGWRPALRGGDGDGAWITDEGNLILDCRRDGWGDPSRLAAGLHEIPGVVEHGMFLGMAAAAYVACADGVRVLQAGAAAD
ncbi:MAG TPA: ribose-5-phosphate isomerase RpiA [Actinomycetota bacterium]|nr:ribose-5-phosphate isomerase RpiA [Actinomycetota bacterium]